MTKAEAAIRFNWHEGDLDFDLEAVTNSENADEFDPEALRNVLLSRLKAGLLEAVIVNGLSQDPQSFQELLIDSFVDFTLNFFVPKRDKLGRFAKTVGSKGVRASELPGGDVTIKGKHPTDLERGLRSDKYTMRDPHDKAVLSEIHGVKPPSSYATVKAALHDPVTAPQPGRTFHPDVEEKGKSGVTKTARVGVPADEVPPPPKVGQLPNLTPHERKVEMDFINNYEKDPQGTARKFLGEVMKVTKPGDAPTFGTDDAKVLHPAWSHPDLSLEERSQNRATLNLALHQTANAIAKRAFQEHLNTLKPGDEVLVTVGGCGAGKGFALKNVPEALEMKKRAKAVWDSAGDQNATENTWIQSELEKRGLKGNYVFVHADPRKQWADPERGVVKRAQDPSDGRMVDAKVFADSYALGAANHKAFHEANKDNPSASFVFLDNTGKPKLLPGMPEDALKHDRRELAAYAMSVVENQPTLPAHVKRGATMGARVWGLND